MRNKYQRKERKSNHKFEVVGEQELLVRVPLPIAEVWAEMQAKVEELTGQAGLQILRAILENEVTHRVGPPHRPSPLKSETNAESGSTTYTYDTDSTCTPASSGDLVKRIDAIGNRTCFAYDGLHRTTGITYPSGAYASVTPAKHFVYDSWH